MYVEFNLPYSDVALADEEALDVVGYFADSSSIKRNYKMSFLSR